MSFSYARLDLIKLKTISRQFCSSQLLYISSEVLRTPQLCCVVACPLWQICLLKMWFQSPTSYFFLEGKSYHLNYVLRFFCISYWMNSDLKPAEIFYFILYALQSVSHLKNICSLFVFWCPVFVNGSSWLFTCLGIDFVPHNHKKLKWVSLIILFNFWFSKGV